MDKEDQILQAWEDAKNHEKRWAQIGAHSAAVRSRLLLHLRTVTTLSNYLGSPISLLDHPVDNRLIVVSIVGSLFSILYARRNQRLKDDEADVYREIALENYDKARNEVVKGIALQIEGAEGIDTRIETLKKLAKDTSFIQNEISHLIRECRNVCESFDNHKKNSLSSNPRDLITSSGYVFSEIARVTVIIDGIMGEFCENLVAESYEDDENIVNFKPNWDFTFHNTRAPAVHESSTPLNRERARLGIAHNLLREFSANLAAVRMKLGAKLNMVLDDKCERVVPWLEREKASTEEARRPLYDEIMAYVKESSAHQPAA